MLHHNWPGVNFTNILWAAFAPKSFCQKIKNKHLKAVQRTLVWLSISPIFYKQLFHTKVLCALFICLQFGFVFFWWKDFGAKAAHKMLVKLTPCVNCINMFTHGFFVWKTKKLLVFLKQISPCLQTLWKFINKLCWSPFTSHNKLQFVHGLGEKIFEAFFCTRLIATCKKPCWWNWPQDNSGDYRNLVVILNVVWLSVGAPFMWLEKWPGPVMKAEVSVLNRHLQGQML